MTMKGPRKAFKRGERNVNVQACRIANEARASFDEVKALVRRELAAERITHEMLRDLGARWFDEAKRNFT